MTITLELPEDRAARLAARPDANEFAAAALADALAADEGNESPLDRLNSAYSSSSDTEDVEEQAHLSRLRRRSHQAVVGREEW
jgi:hypothetical protein